MNIYKHFFILLLLSIFTNNLLCIEELNHNKRKFETINEQDNNNNNNKKQAVDYIYDDIDKELLKIVNRLINDRDINNNKKYYRDLIIELLNQGPNFKFKDQDGKDFYYYINHPDYTILHNIWKEYLYSLKLNEIPQVILNIVLEYTKNFTCNKCSEVCSEEKYLAQHIQNNHPVYKCNRCGRIYNFELALKRHRQVCF